MPVEPFIPAGPGVPVVHHQGQVPHGQWTRVGLWQGPKPIGIPATGYALQEFGAKPRQAPSTDGRGAPYHTPRELGPVGVTGSRWPANRDSRRRHPNPNPTSGESAVAVWQSERAPSTVGMAAVHRFLLT
jgi:hypothetical protein